MESSVFLWHFFTCKENMPGCDRAPTGLLFCVLMLLLMYSLEDFGFWLAPECGWIRTPVGVFLK